MRDYILSYLDGLTHEQIGHAITAYFVFLAVVLVICGGCVSWALYKTFQQLHAEERVARAREAASLEDLRCR